MSINRVNISGHLTRDPELRMTPKGTQVLSFGIAVNDRRLNRETNQWEDYPNQTSYKHQAVLLPRPQRGILDGYGSYF